MIPTEASAIHRFEKKIKKNVFHTFPTTMYIRAGIYIHRSIDIETDDIDTDIDVYRNFKKSICREKLLLPPEKIIINYSVSWQLLFNCK